MLLGFRIFLRGVIRVNKVFKTVPVALLTGAVFLGQAQTVFVRGNLAGYYPNAEKRIVLMSPADISASSWKITDGSGATVAENKVGRSIAGKSEHSPFSFNYEILFTNLNSEGDYLFLIDGSEPFPIKISKNPYEEAISASLRWLRTQRSGSNDVLDRPPSHFGDSAVFIYYRSGDEMGDDWVEDEGGKTLDLQGGWYVGGNYTKSTGFIAYTTYSLLRAWNLAPQSFTKKYTQTDLVDIIDEAKFGLDYLLKVMPNDKDFIINVGGYDANNGTRLPHEDVLDGKRTAYSINSSSDMALCAAALALGAETFKEIDTEFSEKCKAMAVKMFARASSGQHSPQWLDRDGWTLYPNPSDKDDLLLAAAELHKLTNEAKYLNKAKELSDELPAAYWAGWEIQNMAAQLLIADKHSNARSVVQEDLNGFLSNQNSAGNIWNLPFTYTANGLYNCFIIGTAAGAYTKKFGDNNKYSNMALDVLNYNFGLNNWGVSFTALRSIKQSVRRFFLPIYKLQTRLFPEGATSIGPCDRANHDEQSKWILDDVRVNYCYPFNTSAVVFLDHEHDYMSMEARPDGAADNIYLMTLTNAVFGGK